MSVERHAMEAAIEYSKSLEDSIKRLQFTNQEYSRENRQLKRQLEKIQGVVNMTQDGQFVKECPPEDEAQMASMPVGMKNNRPVCPYCGN